MSWLEVIAVLGLGAAQPAPSAEPGVRTAADGPIFTITDYAETSTVEADGRFSLLGLRQHVLVPDSPDRDTLLQLLAAATERGVSLRMRVDASAARLSADGTSIEFPLCALGTSNGASFGNEARNCPPGVSRRREAVTLLALGVAQASEHPELARRTFADALAGTPALPPTAQALAHRFRGEAAEALAQNLQPTDPPHDRLMAEALIDYRRELSLVPADAQAHYSVARALLMLGGYDEALVIYRNIGRRWPEEAFDVAVRVGALYRQQADYRQALRQLDDYARNDPESATGMRFHYHRAWTLTLLSRFEEAEREIERGMASQPDYTSAYQIRACARARMGRLEEALADQQRALELLGRLMTQPSAAIRTEMDRSRAAVAALRRAINDQSREAVTAPCDIFWDRWTRPRQRSPQLATTE